MSETAVPIEMDFSTLLAFGFALIVVGFAICLLGAQSLNLIFDNNLLNGPVIVLFVFATLGLSFIVGTLLTKKVLFRSYN
jgi:hypothetical protein